MFPRLGTTGSAARLALRAPCVTRVGAGPVAAASRTAVRARLARAASSPAPSFTSFLSSPRVEIIRGHDKADGITSALGITKQEVADFNRDGFVTCKGMLADKELDILLDAAKNDETLKEYAFTVDDGEGGNSAMTLWNNPGNDTYGMLMRSARIVESAAAILEDEPYHYHTKLMRKDPLTGGSFAWHQDYGYWYENGCLFPNMVTVFVALDKCTRTNGCLQVMPGSHKMGRLEHGAVGGQRGVNDMERIEAAEKVLGIKHVEMEPGDAMFFHCNTMHRSDQNRSEHPRWALLAAYNAKGNNPYKEHHHPRYTKLDVVGDDAIEAMGVSRAADPSLFMDPDEDHTTKGKRERG